MEQILRISVTLLDNRFHGEDWPSSPARLFRALVAGSMTGRYREGWEQVETALRWLETLPAPEILAVGARAGQKYRISVPNNDMDVAVREWRAGRHFDPAVLRTMKDVKPFLLGSDGPHITYTWRGVDVDGATLTGLRHAVYSLHTFGWGIDMAFADICIGSEDPVPGLTRWRPEDSGEKLLPVPTEGSLQDLRETYRRSLSCLGAGGVDPDTRPSVYRLQAYGSGAVRSETTVFDLRVCQGEGAYSKNPQSAMEIAAWMRHAVSQSLLSEGYDEADVNSAALGHGTEAHTGRLSYLPLPSIGHPNADGRVRRVMVRGDKGQVDEMVRIIARKLRGSTLTDSGGNKACRLADSESTQVVNWYTRCGKTWETVTPIILHGHNAQRGQISNHKTERLLLQAFETAGYDPNEIERMAFQPAPFWPNTGSARSYRVPAHLRDWPRYHVSVVFRNAFNGPVIAGLGRHYGIGTLACPL